MTTITPSEDPADLSNTADVDRLRLVLLRVARRIRTNSISSITPSQLAVLGTLLRHERLTIGQIAEYEHVKPPSASKIAVSYTHLTLPTNREV